MQSTQGNSQNYTDQIPELQAALLKLEAHAAHILQNEPERHHLALMRAMAGELGVEFDVKDPQLERMLFDAAAQLEPVVAYSKGQKLQGEDPEFLVDGLIRLHGTNLIVGQPKVGKSSLICALIACLRDRRQELVGRTINHQPTVPPVLLFGTDQAESDWLYFMRREGLVDGSKTLLDPIEFFCPEAADVHYNFSPAGVERMAELVGRYENPLVIIDSLSSMMGPLGLNENFNEFQAPLKHAMKTLRAKGATVVVLHHTKKRVETWDWIEEARGFGGISSVFSWGLLARWVTSLDPVFVRTDKRVGFVGKGRGSGAQGGAMGIYTDEEGWVALPGLEEAQRMDMLRGKEAALTGNNAKVFDQIVSFNRVDVSPSPKQLSDAVEINIKSVQRCCRILAREGLVVFERRTNGANPERLYRAVTDPEADVPFGAEPVAGPSACSPTRDKNPVPFAPFAKGTKGTALSYLVGEESDSQRPEKEHSPICRALGIGQPVEIQHVDGGTWSNGYVTDGFHPDTGHQYVRPDRPEGDPDRIRLRKCLPPNRVRPCQAQQPAQDPATAPDPGYDSAAEFPF